MLKDIVSSPTEELGRWGRFVWFQVKLWPHCARLLKRNRSGQQAAALSYHTLFGIVPLGIIILMIFQLFPAYSNSGEKAKQALYDYFNLSSIEYPVDEKGEMPSESQVPKETIKLTDKIDEITGRFTANLNRKKGVITIFSFTIVIWAALGLLMTIERSFNSIWHVQRGRNMLHRIVNYWTLLTFGPMLLILGFYLNTKMMTHNGLDGGWFAFFHQFAPYVITVAVFFFLYYLLPNTKVNFAAAIWGAAVAAFVWTGAKYLFAIYVIKFIPQKAVYGVMGIIPLSVIWIYITWFIVLFGLQLTYTTQHLKTLDAEDIKKLRKQDESFLVTDIVVIRIMAFILEWFDAGKGAVRVDDVCNKFSLPGGLVEQLITRLTGKGLLLQVAEPEGAVVLGAEADDISLADIVGAVSGDGVTQIREDMPGKLKELFEVRDQKLSECSLRDIV